MDAVVLADDPRARLRIAGLAAGERARRVAARVGATRILVVDGVTHTRADLAAWHQGSTLPLLVIRADQLVHVPLVRPLVDAALPASSGRDSLAIAVSPTDIYDGALLATGAAIGSTIARLTAGESDAALAAAAPIRVAHSGRVACHPIATPAERRAAHAMLYQILVKPQDNAITRYLYRPVSLPLTRLLVWTPVTPNQVSYAVAVIVAIGCWITAHASPAAAAIGTVIVLAASYLDCCDGEIARVKLTSSRYGAWIDTVIDELSSIAYIAALGWHCHLHDSAAAPFVPAIALGVASNVWSMYCVYYNIIVGVGSANSQDYAGRFEVVPAGAPNLVRLQPSGQAMTPSSTLPGWVRWLATYAPYITRRDFLSWMSVGLALVGATHLLFWILSIGGWIMAVVLTWDHVWLRRLLRSVVRTGKQLVPTRSA